MSLQTENLNLSEALRQFNNEIEKLTDDLKTYNQSPKASARFAFYKSQQIKVLQNVVLTINEFNQNTNQIILNLEKQLNQKEDKILRLEGTCIIHGISDLRMYLNYTVKDMVNLVKEAYAENWRQTPLELLPGYERIKEIKQAPAPIYDFNTLLNGAINNKNNDLKHN